MSQPAVDVILFCGGKGTRLRSLTYDLVPKSLYPVSGKPLLAYTLDNLKLIRVNKLIFAVYYHSQQLVDWVEAQDLPYKVVFSYQREPGILAAAKSALRHTESNEIILCNTDEIRYHLRLDYALRQHRLLNHKATMVTTTSKNLYRHRVIEITQQKKIKTTYLKHAAYQKTPNQRGIVNTGMIIVNRDACKLFKGSPGSNWGSILDRLVENGAMGAYVGFGVTYFNVGTAQEAAEAQKYITRKIHRNYTLLSFQRKLQLTSPRGLSRQG